MLVRRGGREKVRLSGIGFDWRAIIRESDLKSVVLWEGFSVAQYIRIGVPQEDRKGERAERGLGESEIWSEVGRS